MKALFGKGWLWVILALIFFSLVIWFGGPYVSVADYAPLASELARIIAIAVLVVFWGLRALWRELKSARAGRKLVTAVAKQEDPSGTRASADTRQMQQRFEEATAALQKSSKGRKSLYDLPWYIIIGPPGAGKTTAIVNSGLNFPLAQKIGKEALRGVGGTQFVLPLRVAPCGPALGRDPVDARHIRRRHQTFALQQLGITFRAGTVGDDAVVATIEIQDTEHLAADGLVADPEDDVVAPLHGRNDVRESQQQGAHAICIHARQCTG